MFIPLTAKPLIKSLTIADDDWDDQVLLRETMDSYEFAPQVKTVADGHQLMHSLATQPLPDLILLDLNMPNKNGIECLSEIRSHNEFSHLPVVVLSTSKDLRDIESCYHNGANLFISKPYTFNSLKTLVHTILNIDWNNFPRRMDKDEFVKIATEGLIPEIVN
jgi:CheY-like chemotaxis protein